MQRASLFSAMLSIFVALSWSVQAQQSKKEAGSARATGPKVGRKLSELPSVVREEIDRLASDDAGKRATGAASLGEMGAEAIPAIPYLIGALGDSRSVIGPGGRQDVADVAMASLTKLGNPAREALLEALKAQNVRELDRVMWALGKMREPRAVGPLIGFLVDEKWGKWAAFALGDLGDARAVEPLIRLLKNERDVDSTARALGDLKDLRAVEPLIAAMSDKKKTFDAIRALERITGQDFGKDQAKWQEWWEKNKAK